MKTTPLILLLLAACLNLNAQYRIEWERCYGTSAREFPFMIILDINSKNLLLGSSTQGGIDGDKSIANTIKSDYWMLELDPEGQIVEQYVVFSTSNPDIHGRPSYLPDIGEIVHCFDIIYNTATNIINIPSTNRGGIDIKTVSYSTVHKGSIICDFDIGSAGDDIAFSISYGLNNGFLINGFSDGGISFEQTHPRIATSAGNAKDIWPIRIDSLCQVLWTTRLGGTDHELAMDVCATKNNTWLIASQTFSPKSGYISEDPIAGVLNGDIWVVHLDDNGQILWNRRLGSPFNDLPWGIYVFEDSMVVVLGRAGSGAYAAIVDLHSGRIKKSKTYYAANGFSEFQGFIYLPNGNFLFSGITYGTNGFDKSEPSRGGSDGWVMQVDQNLDIVWEKTIGGTRDESTIKSSILYNDNSIYLACETRSPPDNATERKSPHHNPDIAFTSQTQYSDIWLIKLVPEAPMALDRRELDARPRDGGIDLDFSCPPAQRVLGLCIERTADPRTGTFQALARLRPDSLDPCTWHDPKPLTGLNYYRIAYQMSDGSRLYSNIAEVNFFQSAPPLKSARPLRFYPNPTNGPCRIEFESPYSGSGWLELYTLDGQRVLRQAISVLEGDNTIEHDLELAAGNYVLAVVLPNDDKQLVRIQVQ